MLQFEQNASLTRFNTLRLNSQAKYLANISNEHDLQAALQSATAKQWPVFVLSGGSNVLLSEYINALVIRPLLRGIKVLAQDDLQPQNQNQQDQSDTDQSDTDNQVLVEVMAGEPWPTFVEYTLKQGWYGLENLSLIPGFVGAAPIQNIGAYGVEVGRYIKQVKAWHIPTQRWCILNAKACNFGYRDSIFKQQASDWVISRVVFCLNKQPHLVLDYGDVREQAGLNPTAQSVAAAIIHIRQTKLPDPKQIANVGSFFKNPLIDRAQYALLKQQYPTLTGYEQPNRQYKVAAGWLIDQTGWKGKSIGNVGMYEKQALVLVNHSTASLRDVQCLSQAVQDSVYQQFAIRLEQEPVLVKF